jgi:hypothetical protein
MVDFATTVRYMNVSHECADLKQLSFSSKPVLDMNKDPVKSSVMQSSPWFSIFRAFVLDRTEELRGTIQDILLIELLEKLFANKENLAQPEEKVSRLASNLPPAPPILLFPPRFLLTLHSQHFLETSWQNKGAGKWR